MYDALSVDVLNKSSNRTFMELKFFMIAAEADAEGCSNRTFMELK